MAWGSYFVHGSVNQVLLALQWLFCVADMEFKEGVPIKMCVWSIKEIVNYKSQAMA